MSMYGGEGLKLSGIQIGGGGGVFFAVAVGSPFVHRPLMVAVQRAPHPPLGALGAGRLLGGRRSRTRAIPWRRQKEEEEEREEREEERGSCGFS